MLRLNKNKSLTFMTVMLVMVMVPVFFPVKTEAAVLNCSSRTTLEKLFDCIKAQMRLRDDGYTAPTAQQLADLRTVMGQMLDGQTIVTLGQHKGRTLVYKLTGCLNYDIWFACHANQE